MMVNNMVKKTARVIFEVIKKDVKKTDTATNDALKRNMQACINNVLSISYRRAINSAQLMSNLKESVEYISEYLKDQLKELKDYPQLIWTYAVEENEEGCSVVLKINYGLQTDPVPFIIDVDAAFKQLRNK